MTFARGATLTFTILGLLVCASIVFGQMMDTVIVTGKLEVEGTVYILYIEDQTHHWRIRLEGTCCFQALPDWFKPDASRSFPNLSTQFYLERGSRLLEELAQCHRLVERESEKPEYAEN